MEHDPIRPVDLPKYHWLSTAQETPKGRWYRVPAELHAAWLHSVVRAGAGIPKQEFQKKVATSFYGGTHTAVTYAPDVEEVYPGVGLPDLLAWQLGPDGATPMDVEITPTVLGIEQLRPGWPVDVLAGATVMVVGTGSIGAAAAIDLATYGVGRLLLVDPDRLRWHNLVRHVGAARHVGRLKVTALKEQIEALRPDTAAEAHPLDVVADTDRIRALLAVTDAVLCAADGVAPRRVVSHLARQSRIDAVLACVLEDGGLGEILRLRPWPGRGCLLCHRQGLVDAGGMDPEPTLDAGYGTGTSHQPMTAVGGDLHLVASWAAKMTIASILERRGHTEQQLPGEQVLIGLRPLERWAPPYDLDRAGEFRWCGPWPARPDCPTCGNL